MAVYVKVRSTGEYHSYNFSHAVYGFREMGAEIIKYETIDEIYDKVTGEDIVLDYINQSQTIMAKFGAKPFCEDYPEQLKPFMGRRIWKDTIDSINTTPSKWGVFVKPVKDKAFTGLVINGPKDLIGCGILSDIQEQPRKAIYRGWMMKPNQYEEFYAALYAMIRRY